MTSISRRSSIARSVPRMRGSEAGRKPTSGISSRLASSRLESQACTKLLSCRVEAALADFGVDLVGNVAPPLPRLVSLIDCYVVQLSQVFMLRVFPVGTNY
jgi:hypothetical protein